MRRIFPLLAALLCSCSSKLFSQQIDLTVRYEKDSDVIPTATVDQLKIWLASNYHFRNEVIEIRGHTDSDSDNRYNQNLSERRNNSVKKIIEESGFTNIRSTAYGEERPVCLTDDEECKAKNRRVEILLYNTNQEKYLLNNVKKAPETFVVDSEKGDIVVCKEGTKIYIPNDAFTKPDNTPISGNVRLEVREFYNLKDFYENKMTTTSNGKLLESGGTIYIEAYDDDGAVKINESKSLSVMFETQKSGLQKGMQTFYGKIENGAINWVTETSSTSKKNSEQKSTTPIRIENKGYTTWCGNLVDEEYMLKKNKRESLIYFHLLKWEELTEEEKIFALTNNIYTDVKDEEVRKLFTPENYKKYLMEKEKIKRDRIINEKKLAQEKLESQEKRRVEMILRQQQLEEERREYREQLQNNKRTFDPNEILLVNNLGWINCDRFYTATNKLPEVKVKTSGHSDTEVLMVFPKIRSCIRPSQIDGDSFIFREIPGNEEIIIICKGKKQNSEDDLFALSKTEASPLIEIRPELTNVKKINEALLTLDGTNP